MTSAQGGSRLGTRFGPYELQTLIGVGGMGEVYRAYDTVRDRMVAVKVLRAEMAADTSYQARFRRESKMAARLQEPHVIPVHDFGESDASVTSTGLIIGSCAYMAAERFAGGRVGPAADIYSLTCLLYECLTGRAPFEADGDLRQLMSAHMFSPPPRPSIMRRGI